MPIASTFPHPEIFAALEINARGCFSTMASLFCV